MKKMAFAMISSLLAAMLAAGCAHEQQVVITPEEIAQATPVPTPEPTPAPYVTGDVFVVDCEDTINLREKSSSSSELIRELEPGEKARILGYQSQRFAKVELMETGETGYAIAGYFKAENQGMFGLDIVKVTNRYGYEQMQADIAKLAAKYPNSMETDSIGKSIQGRDIPVVRTGNVNAAKHVLIQAAMHGREHMTSLLAMAMLENWLQSGGQSDVCFHIIPMSNPDGVTIAQSEAVPEDIMGIYVNDGQTGRSEDTGALYLEQWQANARGVDLNRNFDAQWENIKTCAAPSFMSYRGESFESEPESVALVEYTKEYPFAATLSYHATGSAIYCEFGSNEAVNAASRELAQTLEGVTAYEPMGNEDGSCGGYKDWAMDKLGIPSVTIEIGTRPAPLTESEFSNIWLRNKNVLKTVCDWVLAKK